MTVKSNKIRTITIEGVAFTPDAKGVTVPADKIAKLKENFFFKHYTDIGAFTVVEEKKDTSNDDKELKKQEREALIQEANELGLEFPKNIGNDKLKLLIEEAKAE